MSAYRVLHYPDLPLLRRYPTLGPQLVDPVIMDVNGRAGSLEMYLGRDLLTVDSELVPVQWTGSEGQQAQWPCLKTVIGVVVFRISAGRRLGFGLNARPLA